MIALHAALLAGKAGRPVRMIYDRHEDLAATTKRHPAIVRHRTGVTRDGRLIAQDIEVVMDGGAYCTLTPVVLSRGAHPCRRPVPLPERPHPRPRDADQHADRTARSAASGRPRPSSRPRPTSTASPRRSEPQPARDPAAERLRARRHDADRPGPARERGRRGGPRTGRRGGRVRAPAGAPRRGTGAAGRVGTVPGSPLRTGARTDRERGRARAGLARRRLHRLGRGPPRVGGVARADRRRARSAS